MKDLPETANRAWPGGVELDSQPTELGTWTYTFHDGMMKCDETARRLYGLDSVLVNHDELVRRSFYPDDVPSVFQCLERAVAPDGDGRYYAEYRVCQPQGSMRWLNAWGVVEFAGEGGRRLAVRLVGASRDITGEKTATTALRESEQRFRGVLESSLDAAYRRDLRTDRYDYLSPSIASITGYSPDEMSSMSIADAIDHIHPEDCPAVARLLGNAEQTGVLEVEYRFLCKDGQYRWLQDYASVTRDDAGNLVFRTGIVRDVTVRKDAEAALEAAMARERQLSVERDEARMHLVKLLAHEIRNPMAGLKGLAQLVANAAPDARIGKVGEMMSAEVDRLSRMLTEVLDAFRLQSGGLPLNLGPIDFSAVVQSALAFHQCGGSHDYKATIESPVTVLGDQRRLEDVVRNLLSNAEKYSDPGSTVTVRLAVDDESAALLVEDQGVGIPADELERVFEAFFRAGNVAFGGVDGVGLGLHLSKNIVERHGGRIWAESNVGEGATFHVRLPLTKETVTRR